MSINLIYFLIGFFLLIPTILWIYIFNLKHPERKSMIFFAFLAGCFSVIPIFFYKHLFTSKAGINLFFVQLDFLDYRENAFNLMNFTKSFNLKNEALSFDVFSVGFLIYLGVGITEEISKHIVINPWGEKVLAILVSFFAFFDLFSHFSWIYLIEVISILILYFVFLSFFFKYVKFSSIDDVIEAGIFGALGFAFVENIYYISSLVLNGAVFSQVFLTALFRVVAISMVHMLCSGVLAYHVGLAHFAGPVLHDKIREKRNLYIIPFFHKLFKADEKDIFWWEQVGIGVFLAIFIHLVFDLVLSLNFGYINLFGLKITPEAIMLPLYFFGGFLYLSKILENKENCKNFGELEIKTEYKRIH
jgi:hypothetical protein